MSQSFSSVIKKTLGLTGVTINAMALIAPGAFLWMTFQLQTANVDHTGASTASDMWTGIVAALIVAFLTALAFAELVQKYPEAGAGSAYYFAEKAFLERGQGHLRWARAIKFVTGWAAHLFYWVYPGVMVAFMATLVNYLAAQFGVTLGVGGQIAICALFAGFVGLLAVRGISGSTTLSVMINIIQLTTLVTFSALAIHFRNTNPINIPAEGWFHPDGVAILIPHQLGGLLFQAAIAVLILVGFESSTVLAAEAQNPRRNIPREVLVSLVIQGVFAYLIQYFAANYALGSWMGGDLAGRGAIAAASSGAPIGDMAIQIGDSLLGGNGFALMITLAVSVAIALLATTLAAMNMAVRISFAMAQDRDMPEIMGLVSPRYSTPYTGVVLMVIVSTLIGAIGVSGGVVSLTGVVLASNLGTFVLYGLICGIAAVAFAGQREFHPIRHRLIPLLGVGANLIMILAIFVIGLTAGGVTTQSTLIGLAISGIWLILSVLYFFVNKPVSGTPSVPPTIDLDKVRSSGSGD